MTGQLQVLNKSNGFENNNSHASSYDSLPLIARLFLVSASILLLLTASLKIIALVQAPAYLNTPDPLIYITSRYTTLASAAFLEVLVAITIYKYRTYITSIMLLLWLCAIFITYRAGFASLEISDRCLCLGGIPSMTKQAATLYDAIGLAMLIYMASGCFLVLAAHGLKYLRK